MTRLGPRGRRRAKPASILLPAPCDALPHSQLDQASKDTVTPTQMKSSWVKILDV